MSRSRKICAAIALLFASLGTQAIGERPTPQEWRAYNRAGAGAYYLCRLIGRAPVQLHTKIGGPVRGYAYSSDEIVLWGAAYDAKRVLWYRTSANRIPVGGLDGWFRASAVDCSQQISD